MNKLDKKLHQDLIEVKFKNKEELAQSQLDLQKNLANYKSQIFKAKQNETALKIKIKEDIIKDKQILHKNKLNEKLQLQTKKDLIKHNKINLKNELLQNKKELKLIKFKQIQKIIQNKKIQKNELLNVKFQIQSTKKQQKQFMFEIKNVNKQKTINIHKELVKQKNKVSQIKIEQGQLITNKKIELLKERSKLNVQKKDGFRKRRVDRTNRLSQARAIKQDLKKQFLKEKAKYKVKILEIKNQELISKNKLQENKNEYKSHVNDIKNKLVEKRVKVNKELVQEVQNINLANLQTLANNEQEHLKTKENAAKIFDKFVDNNFNKTNQSSEIENSKWSSDKKEHTLFRGSIIHKIGKSGLKRVKKITKDESKLKLDKLPFNKTIIDNIKKFQKLKKTQGLIDIKEFVKYASFLTQDYIPQAQIKIIIFSIIYNILKGKTFAFLGGYFYLAKIRGYKTIEFSRTLIKPQRFVVSLQKEDFVKKLEKRIWKTLNNEGFIQILNNIAIKKEGDDILVVTDLPFMK